MKIKELCKRISFSVAAMALLFIGGKEVCAQEIFTQDNICYEVTGSGIVEVDDLTEGFNENVLTIPSTVTYNNQVYTVTSVNMDHLARYYSMVQEMVVPSTVIERVVVMRTDYASYIDKVKKGEFDSYDDEELAKTIFGDDYNENDKEDYDSRYEALNYQAFPNLKIVHFLGEIAPSVIQIEKYVYDEDLYYEVPVGKIDAYMTNVKNINLFFYAGYNDAYLYKTREIFPVVMSQDGSVPESNLFSTSKGEYLVKEKAQGGVGKVVLIHAVSKDPYYTYPEYSVESRVTNGVYSYDVDEIETAALTDVRALVLNIPDSVTVLNRESISAFASCVFLSKNCKKVPDSVIEFHDSDEGTPFVYATGLEKIGKYDPFFITCGKLVVSKKATIKDAKMKYPNLVRVTPVKKGATIKAPKEISVNINQSKSIKASFKSKTKEHLKYMLLDFDSVNMDGENEYVKLSENGKITAKKAGVAYVLVYSLESGKHKLVTVRVKKDTFKQGIYTYAINNDEDGKNTVTIRKCSPNKNQKTLELPSKVTYKGITYTVTGVYAEEAIDWDKVKYTDNNISYYPNPKPIISDKVAKKSKITKIVVPATMVDAVFLTCKLPKLTKIEFKGKTPPKKISYWAKTKSQVTVYVPKKKLSKYRKRIYGYGKDWNCTEVTGYTKKYIKGY